MKPILSSTLLCILKTKFLHEIGNMRAKDYLTSNLTYASFRTSKTPCNKKVLR